MFEGKHLFNCRLPSREESSSAHLGRIVSLLGPPPADLLARGSRSPEYFNEDGKSTLDPPNKIRPRVLITVLGILKVNPTGVDATLEGTTLEDEEAELDSVEKKVFLTFMRKMLRWRPEDRLSARQLIEDPWLQTGWR